MADVTIGQMRVTLPGLSEREGERLSRLIAHGLAGAAAPIESSRSLDRIQVTVEARPDTGADMLSKIIVAEVLRQLERSV